MEQPDSQQPRPSGDLPPLVAAAHRLLQEYAKLPRPTADELLDTLLGDISTPTSSHLTSKENAVTLTSALHTEAAGSQPTPPLSDDQLDGIACVRCGATQPPMVPTGHGPRGQLFACSPACGPEQDEDGEDLIRRGH